MIYIIYYVFYGTYSILACFVRLTKTALLQLVGPVLAQDSKPVIRELDSFLSQGLSEGHGAVYVSMGTLARMKSDELHNMAQALSALPNPVLWKLNPLHLPGVLCVSSKTVV